MSDSGKAIFPDFGKLVPGFDFLQNLTRQASGAASSGLPKMPNLGSWVAPTLNVEELDRRIEELKAVQFWLDQNATALKATIQALEVQKMTLAALQGMNVNVADMAKAFQMPDASGKAPGMASGMAAATDMVNTMASNMASSMANMANLTGMAGKSAEGPSTHDARADSGVSADKPHHQFAGLEVPETGFMRREQAREQARGNGAAQHAGQQDSEASQPVARDPAAEAVKAGAGVAAVIDPMQWWGALTQQFQTIANAALQDVAQRKPFETSQSLAQDAMRTASKTASDFAESASKTLVQSASSARELMTGALNVGDGWPVPGPAKTSRKGASSRTAVTSRKAAPARAGAMASDDKASGGRSKAGSKAGSKAAGSKAPKTTKGAAASRSSKSEGKASRSTRSTASSSARSAPQARASTTGIKARGGKARTTTAARKTSPRAR